MVYHCACCAITKAEVCQCVITTCGECSMCRTHCLCFSVALTELIEELGAEGGPFAGLTGPTTGAIPPTKQSEATERTGYG